MIPTHLMIFISVSAVKSGMFG